MENGLELALNIQDIDELIKNTSVTYDYGYYTVIPYIIGIITIISIIVAILMKKRKNIVISCVFGILGLAIYKFAMNRAWGNTPMLGGGGPTTIHIQYPLISKILFVISIIIQLIPFIMCLRNNKNVKKDEVKQENV